MSYSSEAIDKLRLHRVRVTSARKTVLKLLEKCRQPISAFALYQQIKQHSSHPPIDRVSVHRILRKLEELGLVHRVLNKGLYMACLNQDCFDSYHILANCHHCNKVKEVSLPAHLLKPLYEHIQKQHHFVAKTDLVQILGTCINCQPH